MFLQIINTLAPVFMVIALGAFLRAYRFLSPEFFFGMNRLTFWVGLPCLLFYKIASSPLTGGVVLLVIAALVAGMALAMIFSFLISVRMESFSRGAFIQASFRGNLVYVGLPVMLYAISVDNGYSPEFVGKIETIAVLALAPLVPVYNICSVVALMLFGGDKGKPSLAEILKQIFTNPLLLACLAGVAVSSLGMTLPSVVFRTCEALGKMALPLALLSIGASLSLERLKGSLFRAFSTALVKVAVGPLAGYFICRWIGVPSEFMIVVMIFLACPTAAASYVMAEQMGADSDLAGSAVVISTLLSLFSLAAVVALFG